MKKAASMLLCVSVAAQGHGQQNSLNQPAAPFQSQPTTVAPESSLTPTTTTLTSGAVTPVEASTDLGKIVMYRGSSVFGAGVACPIRYKGQDIEEISRGKFAEWSVPPGRYILNNHTSSIELSVNPGETRYVRCMIKMGFLAGRADLQVVDEESFNEHRSEFSQKDVNTAAK